ncbi:hypothetical protein SAMN05421858_3248 [Haladaptatus litoreus]|uniref:DUF7344 domain-containing protein n=1 Tax=Haladaptatus litoreus TaxID=553468 RepID=A0A1N7CTR3_9EURY|nr:hypothetical protein [Haladaptatus litoreus]SIR66971.1 hypothetical protein SAMN05421858_3248 [Haladaptatus litoreus]
MLEILADPSRRQLLVALDEHNLQEDDIEISADVVTSGDKGAQPTLQMVHTHLPKLADAELIEWDQQTHQVREGPHFDEIQPLVEMVQDHMNNRPSARD